MNKNRKSAGLGERVGHSVQDLLLLSVPPEMRSPAGAGTCAWVSYPHRWGAGNSVHPHLEVQSGKVGVS